MMNVGHDARRNVIFKDLESNWSYVSTEGGQVVLGLKPVVTNIWVPMKDGKAMLNPDGSPIYCADWQIVVKKMTKAEYRELQGQSGV